MLDVFTMLIEKLIKLCLLLYVNCNKATLDQQKAENQKKIGNFFTSSRLAISLFSAATSISSSGSRITRGNSSRQFTDGFAAENSWVSRDVIISLEVNSKSMQSHRREIAFHCMC